LGLNGARAVVWWPGDGDEAAVEERLSDGSTQASREGVGAVRTVTPRVTETIIKSLKW
jgi:hypothetical protein